LIGMFSVCCKSDMRLCRVCWTAHMTHWIAWSGPCCMKKRLTRTSWPASWGLALSQLWLNPS
jgi:hypothetical protein